MAYTPSQFEERIYKALKENNIQFDKITKFDWNYDGPQVGIWLDDEFYGIFNYDINEF